MRAQLESKIDGHNLASTQVDLPIVGEVAGWVAGNLSEAILDPENGVERQPHVTLLYGLDKPDTAEVMRIGRQHGGPIKLELGPLEVFEAENHDVLYSSVTGDDVHKLHNALRQLPNFYRFPNYVPHMTVAYLKKGQAKKFRGPNPFRTRFSLPGFWLSFAKNHGAVFVPTVGAKFRLQPSNEELCSALDMLGESVGRRRPKRQMRMVYLKRSRQGVPAPKNEVEELIDDLIWDVHQVFDWSAIYSGDRQQARIAANDLFDDVMKLARIKIADEASKEDGLRFTLSDVLDRWNVLVRYARLSSEIALRSLRRRVRV